MGAILGLEVLGSANQNRGDGRSISTLRRSSKCIQKVEDTPILYLSYLCPTLADLVRVPVAVKDDNSVGSLQVEAQTSSSGAQKENKVLRSLLVELLEQRSPIL